MTIADKLSEATGEKFERLMRIAGKVLAEEYGPYLTTRKRAKA